MEYENIAEQKDVGWELTVLQESWSDLKRLPPCAHESGGFLARHRWTAVHEHPYRLIPKLKATHGHLAPTPIPVEPHTAFAVPFYWLNRQNIDEYVQPRVTEPLPPEEPFPKDFNSAWTFSPVLQEAILAGFFAPVTPDESIAIFYTKSNQPVSDSVSRLVVAIADVKRVDDQRYYDVPPDKRRHPIWERAVGHSLKGDGSGGFLLPFHQYLAPTGDPEEDTRRHQLAQRLVVTPEPDRIAEFSYRTEHVSADSVISVISQALSAVHLIREDGIADGNWAATESWLNARLARALRLRGPHPGIGAALEAMGLRLGTALCYSLAQKETQFVDNPWALITKIMIGDCEPPHRRFATEIEAFQSTWRQIASDKNRLALATCLSRFSLTVEQARRWWDTDLRTKTFGARFTDEAVVENPYLLVEWDVGGGGHDQIVSFGTVDLGMLAQVDDAPQIASGDRRRRRAALTSVLRQAAADGDTLLGFAEARTLVEKLPLAETVNLPDGWIPAELTFLEERLTVNQQPPEFVQLKERAACASLLQRKLSARATRSIPPVEADWNKLLVQTIRDSLQDPSEFDPNSARVEKALQEQTLALRTITSRKLTCLVGRAGTGKTTVLGALSRAPAMQGDVLFLAPTGKARVRLESRVHPGTPVKTVAQFLYENKRYDGKRQKPKLGPPCYEGHQNIVIDESSMLTEDDLAAVLATFTTRVQRLILVGDPAQLPPIGPGRPFADLVAYLDPINDDPQEDPDDVKLRRDAIATLHQEVRTVAGNRSDTLRLASWFTGEKASPDGERIFSSLTDGTTLNDLDVRFWTTLEELHEALLRALRDYLNIRDAEDLKGFNESFLMRPYENGWITGDPKGAERWQILSPVHADVWGCDDINRWTKSTWRGRALRKSREYHAAFGPQEILKHDKIILLKNGLRDGYCHATKQKLTTYLANGEVGLAHSDKIITTEKGKSHVMNLVFASRAAEQTFGFWKNEFGGETGSGIIELAYALTVHKAQGSEFGVVIVVLPKGRMAYRELIYTALTRSRQKLVLLVQGGDISDLLALRLPSASETNRRNTNLFATAVREAAIRPFARHLVHRAEDGTLLRSKSELFIYTRCVEAGLRPRYEERFNGSDGRWKLPDFTFEDDAGDPILWEHLGMMDDPGYASDWSEKLKWYGTQGIREGKNLFWTQEVGGLDAGSVSRVIDEIKKVAS